jgi:hypothetical protein
MVQPLVLHLCQSKSVLDSCFAAFNVCQLGNTKVCRTGLLHAHLALYIYIHVLVQMHPYTDQLTSCVQMYSFACLYAGFLLTLQARVPLPLPNANLSQRQKRFYGKTGATLLRWGTPCECGIGR